MVATLVHKFKFEPADEETGWAVRVSLYLLLRLLTSMSQAFGIQFPYLKKEEVSPGRLPKLPLKVTEIKST